VIQRPKFRDDVVVRRMSNRHETYVIVKDPVELTYYKFEPWEEAAIKLLDGTRDHEALAREFDAVHPEMCVDAQWMVDYVEGLNQTGLMERTEQEQHLIMMDKLKEVRNRRLYNADSSTLFEIQFPLFDPDKLLDRVIPWIRWWWAPWVVIAWLVVFTVVIGFLIFHWDLYWAGFFSLFDPRTNTLWDWVFLILLIFGVSIWHELGHGLSCKRYGGEVHDIGFALFFFEPAFYCKIDDSYMMPKKGHRLFAVFGGPYFELMLCSVAAAVWLTTPAEWWLHSLALSIVFITGISVLFNANPLLKLDGYYALMDWVDIPDLREESFDYINNLFKKHVLRLSVPEKAIPRRRRRIFLVYGTVAVAYTFLILTVLYGLARRWLVGWFGPVGYLVLFAIIAYMFRGKLKKGVRFMRYLWLDKREFALGDWRGWLVGCGLLVFAFLLAVPRSPTRIEASFVVEPGHRVLVRAPAQGLVRSVDVAEGSSVTRGQLLAVLSSEDLTASHRLASSDVHRGLRLAAGARSDGDIVAASEWFHEVEEAKTRLRVTREKLDRLALTAPISGVVSTPDLEQTRGRVLDEGEIFCAVDQLDTVRLAIATSEADIEEIQAGTAVRMAAVAYPGRTMTAHVLSLAPVANPPDAEEERRLDLIQRVSLVRVLVEIQNEDGTLRPGMTGRVQFITRPRSAAGKIWWRFSRWFSSVVW
jgi:putative peptide zinc metalloprotease protein